jgi:hypothetical protein
MKSILVLASIIWFSFGSCDSCPPCQQQGDLCIAAPSDSGQVVEREAVCGEVSNPKATVWVVVHPMEVSTYWIQPAISVKQDGKWKVQVYVGRPGSVDIGKHFEIMAIANPKLTLKEGDQLSGWPEAEWKSQVIEVIRK